MAAQPNDRPTVDEIHAASTIKEILLSKLQVDRSYQRDPSIPLIDKLAEEWDVIASELVLVSDRGPRPESSEVAGGMFIVNGQHRMRAALKLGHKKIWARVIDLTQVEDPGALEAQFRLKTNVRLGDRIHERFKAQLRAGDEESHAIVNLLARFDAEINLVPTNEKGINCITTVETIYRVDNGALLRDTLEVIKRALLVVGGKNVNAGFLKGLAWFVEKHSMDADVERLAEKISVMGVNGLERRARAMQSTFAGALWINYYRTLVDIYNEKLAVKNRLELSTRGTTSLRPRQSATGERPGDHFRSGWGRHQ